MKLLIPTFLILSLGLLRPAGFRPPQSPALGVFEGHGDVGTVLKPGAVEYDAARKTYL